MKRSAPFVCMLLLMLSVGLLLLVDPFAWFGPERAAVPLAPSTQTADGTARDAVVAVAPVPTPGATNQRQVVDRLVEGQLVAFCVIAPSGQPMVGVQVLVQRKYQLLCDELTDDNGEVELAADARPAALFIAVEHRLLERRDVVLAVGRQEILLTEGSCVSGRFVTADGASPGQLRFVVDSDHPPSSTGSLPAVVEAALPVSSLRREYAIVNTDEAGGFEFTGLPRSWSGRLLLRRGWKVESTSHGDVLPLAQGIRLAEPTTGIVVRVAPHETLHGRLVLRDDGSPLAGAQLAAMLRSSETTSPFFATALTDADGHFELEAPQERISSLDLRLGGRFHEGLSILVLDRANLPVDGDLGDVVVDNLRHVAFLLQDVTGQPIARGVADAAGTRSAPTGAHGRGELRWLARSVTRMVVEAPGFVPAEREIPRVVAAPLVVIMQPANGLVATLRLPAGADPTQFKVALRGAERITAAPVASSREQRRHVAAWTYPLVEFMQTDLDSYLCGRPDAEGRVTFRALRAGVEIELRVCGITGNMVYHTETVAPLAPAEHRELVVSLEHGMIVFRGRVVDQEGVGLARATLQLGNQILGFTDDDGAFRCYLATPDTGTLIVQHQACATRYVRDYAVPTGGQPVEFRLNAARAVTIEVVDENGAPVPQAEVWTWYEGFTTNTHRIAGNRHLASSVPEAPFVLIARLAGREYRVEHDPLLPDARIVVPVHGQLAAMVAATSIAGRAGEFVLILVPPEGEGAQPVTARRGSAPGLRIEIPAVHPGTYQASLRYVPSAEEREAGREESHSESVPVVIEAGRETEIPLALPAGGG